MSIRTIWILYAGFIFLGFSVSFCLGGEEFLQQFTDNRDLTDLSDNNQNLMQLIQQYASNINNRHIPDEDSNEEKSGSRRKRDVMLNQEETKNFPTEKEDTGDESIADFSNCGIMKRSVSLPKNPQDMGFKNRPGFRSWGGKRSKYVMLEGKGFLPGVRRIRKSKFNNWGGKRSESYDLGEFERWFKEKRDKFRSWGGKRAVLVPPTLRTGYDSPSKFSNWGGKRFDKEEYTNGKRDLEYAMPFEQESENEFEGKRSQFQSWGGKRVDSADDGFLGEKLDRIGGINWFLQRYVNSILHLLQNDRRIGKKNIFGSKPLEDDGDLTKSGFSAWRGRR